MSRNSGVQFEQGRVSLETIVQVARDAHRFSADTYRLLSGTTIKPFENYDGMSLSQLAAREIQSLESLIRRWNSGIPMQVRPLSVNEWERIKCICAELEFALRIVQQPYGFAVIVCGQRNPGEQVKDLLWLDEGDIPIPRARGFCGQHEALRVLFETTHTERNQALIKQFGLEPLKSSIDYYTY